MNTPVERTRNANARRTPQHTPPTAEVHAAEHEAEHEEPRARKRTRQHSDTDHTDPFYVNLSKVPPDVSVEWKKFTAVGLEDPFYLARMREQGWEPVNPLEHPDWVPVPPGYDKPTIIKDGLILMERPMELTQEAVTEREQLARKQVREAEQRLGKTGEGEAERVKPTITKEMFRQLPQAIEE